MLIGSDFPEVRGLYVQNNEGHIPTWGLAVFRTWLAPGKQGADLLASMAAHRWPETTDRVELESRARADGAAIAVLRCPSLPSQGADVTSAWLLVKSSAEVVLVMAMADADAAGAADEAAEQLVEAIEIVTPYPEGLDAAWQRGSELAALYRQNGAAPWWGQNVVTTYYYGRNATRQFVVEARRQPIGGSPASGYEGSILFLYDRAEDSEEHSWTLGADGASYVRRIGMDLDRQGQPMSTRLREVREAGETTLQRVMVEGRRVESTVQTGPAFIAPRARDTCRVLGCASRTRGSGWWRCRRRAGRRRRPVC